MVRTPSWGSMSPLAVSERALRLPLRSFRCLRRKDWTLVAAGGSDAGDVGGEEVDAVSVEVASGAVVALGGAGVGVTGEDLGVAQGDAGVDRRDAYPGMSDASGSSVPASTM